MKIFAHTLFKNEERYLWYSVMSVLPFVDSIFLWDTESTDLSAKIAEKIATLYPNKVMYRRVRQRSAQEFTDIRKQMLEATQADWLMIVDADEVWWDGEIEKITKTIHESGDSLETIVTYYKNIIGDIFHYQEERAGNYIIDNIKGHLTIRAMNLAIPGLKIDKPHGRQAFYDQDNVPIQERDKSKRFHIKTPGYLHFTHVVRSSDVSADKLVPKRNIKLKFEIGKSFSSDFYYPEIFFRERPDFIPDPWFLMDKIYKKRAYLETPLRKFKRRIFKIKDGY